jgi:hypothetical protein
VKLRIIPICACLLGLTSQLAFAGGSDLPAPRDMAHPQVVLPPPKRWVISSDIYLWGIASKGTMIMKSHQTKPTDRYRKFLRHMRSALMVSISGSKGPYGGAFNGMYVELKYHNNANGNRKVTRHNFGTLEGLFSYRAYKRIISQENNQIVRSFSVVPYGGLRFLADTWHIDIGAQRVSNSNEWWLQPVAGSRFIFQFLPNWDLAFSSDLGFWNTSNYTYNNILMLSYNKLFTINILSLNLGYRFMHVYHQRDGDTYKFDMNLYGPLFGMSITI